MSAVAPARPPVPPCEGMGPVQTAVAALVSHGTGVEVQATVAERSPLGPRAIRLLIGRDTPSSPVSPDALARWLAAQSWVAGVSVRPRHLYVQVSTDALASWVSAGLSNPRRADVNVAAPQAALRVLLADDAWPVRTLGRFRAWAVARGLAAVVERGESAMGAEGGEGSIPAPVVVVVGGDSPPPGGKWANVAEVDVRQGSLAARHGGTVVAEDLIGDIASWTTDAARDPEGDAAPAPRSAGEAQVALVFSFLRTERGKRIQLDDARLRADVLACSAIFDARQVADARAAASGTSREQARSKGGDRAVRDLALELEMMPGTVRRAVAALDPAVLVRLVRALADRTHAAAPHLAGGDPLWSVTGRALDVGLGILAVGSPVDDPVRPDASASFPTRQKEAVR